MSSIHRKRKKKEKKEYIKFNSPKTTISTAVKI